MMEDGGGVGDVHYRFTPVAGGEKLEFLDKDTLQNLEQWGMLGGLRRHRFAYTGKFETYKAQDYFTEMVNSRDVQYALQVMSGASSGFCRLSSLGCQDAMHVAVKELSATVTDLTFFDRIADTDTGLISPSGTFKQPNVFDRMPDDPDSFDLVRMMLACDHSPHKDLYSMPERQELIFRIFYHLVLGGAICQYDESLQRYTSTTAAIYGKLVTPYKNPDSQDQRILLRAHAFELCVKASADDGQCILPGTAPAADSLTLDLSDGGGTVSSPSFAYAVVEPLRKQVTVLSFDRRAGSWNDE